MAHSVGQAICVQSKSVQPCCAAQSSSGGASFCALGLATDSQLATQTLSPAQSSTQPASAGQGRTSLMPPTQVWSGSVQFSTMQASSTQALSPMQSCKPLA